jgi:hypothetical protein
MSSVSGVVAKREFSEPWVKLIMPPTTNFSFYKILAQFIGVDQ